MTTTAEATYTTETLEDPTALAGVDWNPADALYPNWKGLNYDTTMTVKEIAATVRRELRKAVKAGTLGNATGVTVRYRTFAGGCAIDTVLTVEKRKVDADTPGAAIATDRWGDEYWAVAPYHETNKTEPAAEEARAKAARFIATFNHNRNNAMVDYFDVKFYGHVTIEGPGDGDWRKK